jgi:hypothetical protein
LYSLVPLSVKFFGGVIGCSPYTGNPVKKLIRITLAVILPQYLYFMFLLPNLM